MLLTSVPPAEKLAPISPVIAAEALLLVSRELAIVSATVWVHEHPKPVHVLLLPVAKIFTSIGPEVGTVASNHVLVPLTLVDISIYPRVFPLAVLH